MSKRFVAGLGLIVAFLGAVFAPLAHLALVPHVRCAEHGELAHQPAVPTLAGAPAGDAPAASAGASLEGDEHDHCLVQASPRATFGLQAPRVAAGLALTFGVEGTALPARAAVELLQLAPKSSPPVAA